MKELEKSQEHKIGVDGYCQVCEKRVSFLVDLINSFGEYPNFRERLVCPICQLNTRQRFVVAYIKNNYRNKSIYAYEQTTVAYQAIKKLSKNVIGSEFVDAKGGGIH